MDRDSMLKQIHEVFVEVLDDEELHISPESSAATVPGWDSLTHVQLVVEIEKRFKVRFHSKEIQGWKNVGDMMDCIQSRQ